MPSLRAARSPILMFAAAFLVRLYFFVTLFRTTPIHRVWETGYEACHIAASLASGGGFSSPFGVPTGPTAWVPPVYTWILAAVFRTLGAYSTSAAWTMLLLNAVIASFTAVAIYVAGERIFGNGVGVVAGWIWALFPYAVIMSIKVWETTLSALLVVIGLLLYERLRHSRTRLQWAVWGLFWGFVVLVNPALGIFFPVLSIGAVWPERKRMAKSVILAFVISAAVVAPWIVRNYFKFYSFVPVRSNFSEELWLGNHENVTGPADESRHPLGDPRELTAYRQLGERDFMSAKLHAATTFISAHPGDFAHLTLRRIAHFWTSPPGSWWLYISFLSFVGLALAMRKNFLQALPFATALLLFPGVYFLTHSDNWYRHPIEPLMILLVVFTIVNILQHLRRALGRVH
jgi:4-amino-4-deoxy-L-arabinose transferase-like glycosyltransferase